MADLMSRQLTQDALDFSLKKQADVLQAVLCFRIRWIRNYMSSRIRINKF
jgi:hypothetical protein